MGGIGGCCRSKRNIMCGINGFSITIIGAFLGQLFLGQFAIIGNCAYSH